MVFGWGKKKEEEELPVRTTHEKEIHLNDVIKIMSDLEELRKSQTLSEIKNLRNNTVPLIDDLIKIGHVLEKDNLQVDDIDKHLAIIVVRGKKQVISVIKKDVTRLIDVSSIDDAEKLDTSLNQILKKVGDVLGRQTRVIHIFAKKYAAQLKENLEIMNSTRAEIHKLLKNHKFTKTLSDDIIIALNEIETQKKIQLEKTQKINNANENIILLNEKIISSQNSIDEIKSSKDYTKYLDLKNTLDSFSSQKLTIKNDIDVQFTKISRPLSRYEYGSSLDKDQKILLSKLVKNPIDVVISQNKDSVILILDNVRKGISSGSISVKDIDKSLSYIIETQNSFDGFAKRLSEYFEKYEKMNSELNSLTSDELVSLEHELNKNISLKDDFESKSKIFQSDISESKSKILQVIFEIEDKLRQFSNTRYTIINEN